MQLRSISAVHYMNTFKVIYLTCSRLHLVTATFLTLVFTHAYASGTPKTCCAHPSNELLTPSKHFAAPIKHAACNPQTSRRPKAHYGRLLNKLRVPPKHTASTLQIRCKHPENMLHVPYKTTARSSQNPYWISK